MKSKVEKLDVELINEFKQGHELSFEVLLNKYKNKVFTSIYIIVKNEDIANDIFQDTFIKVIDKLKQNKYNDEGKFLNWVLRISHNLCMDYFRKNSKEAIISNDNPDYNIIDNIYDKEDSGFVKIDKTNQLDLIKYIDMLPEEQKEIIILRNFYDYSFKEIAEMTNTNMNTALGRMRYALINLRKFLKKDNIEDNFELIY